MQWWPIFNVADIAVTVGGTLLLLSSLRADKGPVPAATDVTDGEPAAIDGIDAPVTEAVADRRDEP